MKFGIVNAFTRSITIDDHKDIETAMTVAGLDKVDHAVLAPAAPLGLAIMVHEFGLFTPVDEQAYFSIGGRLFAGNAVLYGFDKMGETVNIPGTPRVVFLPNIKAVERNIDLGLVQRPKISINGVVMWRWPDPREVPK